MWHMHDKHRRLNCQTWKNICIANSGLALQAAFAYAASVVFLHKILYFCFSISNVILGAE